MSTIANALEQALQGGEGMSWISIKHGLSGVPVDGITAMSWRRRRGKQNNYGSGTKPYNRSRGKVEFDASITVYGDFYLALVTASGGDLTALAPTTYTGTVTLNGQLYTVEFVYAEFMEEGFDANEGDMTIPVTLPLIVGDIVVRKGV